ncbi:MAG TPA: polyribonucleotide nucleotidyltransferase [Candidatus Omnitrophota bacterium]|nr:polyribonucleotide nucleotidyltransferase [Candidatus Omnitrophota bacterium]
MFSPKQVSFTLGGQEIIIETGKVARQASGSVLVKSGGSVVLVAVVGAPESETPRDFFPLTVDFRERTYAAGRIPGGFFKREGKASEREVLVSRLIDRPIRSLFPKNYRSEVSVSIMVLSSDPDAPTDILAMIGSSAAIHISNIPFAEPMGSVRVGLIDGNFVINPTLANMEVSDLDLVIAGTKDKIGMLEAGSNEISEEKMFEAIMFGHKAIQEVVAAQHKLFDLVKPTKRVVKGVQINEEYVTKILDGVGAEFKTVFGAKTKEEQDKILGAIKEKALALFDVESDDFKKADFVEAFAKVEKKKVREGYIKDNKRVDGRGFYDIRQITCETGLLPRTHGSSLFTRGQTQSLGVTTLGTGQDEQTIDLLHGQTSKSFILHYNFPSFSVNESKPDRGPGRREVGHGALAERALAPVIPGPEEFPYTIRVVSDILESNGSSSMASVCAGTLSLMDAGVPIKAPVSGIAMGLVTEGDEFRILTDIAGIEDHLGDMDFKAAGTVNGLTAIQMDLKLSGISEKILKAAFDDSKKARMTIMKLLTDCIAQPKQEVSEFAPRITTIQVDPEKIGEIIGPGGKNIRKLVEETGAKIDISDDGSVNISAVDKASVDAALAKIAAITEEPEHGKTYEAEVKKLTSFGAFCEIIPGKDGLLHVSEMADGFVKSPGDYLKVGDKVTVQVVGVDDRGKVSLSVKSINPAGLPLLPESERVVIEAEPPRGDRGGRGGDRGGRGGFRGGRR